MIRLLYIGIDISKEWFDACALHGRTLHERQFTNDSPGITELLIWVRDLAPRNVHVCMEYTGGLERELADTLVDEGWIVSVEDGFKLTRYKESFGRARPKTDKEDAKALAFYCKERKPKPYKVLPDERRELRELNRQKATINQALRRAKNQSLSVAKNTLVCEQRNSWIQILEQQLKDVEDAIDRLVEDTASLNEDLRLVCSVKGLGATTAICVLAELGPIEHYDSARAVALAMGLAPIARRSGKLLLSRHLPVYGNQRLRNSFYFPAIVAMTHNPEIRAFAARLRATGRPEKVIRVAVMRKLAHIVYGVLSSKKPYDPQKVLRDML